MSTSRESTRDALVALLTTTLVGAGLPVKTVTGAKVTDLSGLTPLVAVLSAGTLRRARPINHPTFHLEVQVWVRQECTGWTNAQAEDALDEIEALISSVFEDNRATGNWAILEYRGASEIKEFPVAGIAYYTESIPVLCRRTTN